MVVTALGSAPHRASVDSVARPGRRVSAREAMAEFRARGLGEVSGSDLEVYRLVMSPVEFKRLCVRLDTALLGWAEHHHRLTWADGELPFGDDLQDAAEAERRRQWTEQPGVVRHPHRWDWVVVPECQVPGRLRLVEGREFTAVGVRGRLRFRYGVRTIDGGFWLEAFDRDGGFRSIDPGRVRRVHRKARMAPVPKIKPRSRKGARS